MAHYGAAVTLTTWKNEISSLTNSGMSVAFTARNLKRNENRRIIYNKKFTTKLESTNNLQQEIENEIKINE